MIHYIRFIIPNVVGVYLELVSEYVDSMALESPPARRMQQLRENRLSIVTIREIHPACVQLCLRGWTRSETGLVAVAVALATCGILNLWNSTPIFDRRAQLSDSDHCHGRNGLASCTRCHCNILLES